MYISSGGGSGKGSAHPNQQTASASTAPTTQQQNATLPQQIYQPNIPQMVMQQTFHPSYMPRPPNSQLYTSTPQIHFPQSQLQSFAPYSYIIANPLISAQPRPNILQGSISHNPNPLALSGVGVVPTNIAAQTQCPTTAFHSAPFGGNTATTTTTKKRKHAIAIINPITKKNVLDEYQMSKTRGTADSKPKTKSVEIDTFSCDQLITNKNITIQQQSQTYNIIENAERKINDNRELIGKDENSNNIPNSMERKESAPKTVPKNFRILVKDSVICPTNDTRVISSDFMHSDNIIASKSIQVKCDSNNMQIASKLKEDISIEEQPASRSSSCEKPHEENKVMSSEATQTAQPRAFYQRTEATLNVQDKIPTISAIANEGTKLQSTVIESNKKTSTSKRKKYQSTESAEKKASEGNKNKTELEEELRQEEGVKQQKEEVDYFLKKKDKKSDEPAESRLPTIIKNVDDIDPVVDRGTKLIPPPSEKCSNAPIILKPEEKILSRKFESELSRSNEGIWQNIDIKINKETVKASVDSEKPRTSFTGTGNKSALPINYKEDQWSPSNVHGKKVYDIQQLLLLSNVPQSKVKPKINTGASYILLQNPRPPPTPLSFNSSKSYKNCQLVSNNNDANNILNLQAGSKSISKSANGKQNSKLSKPGMIHVRLSLRENIKLNETENAWKPTQFKSDDNVQPDIREKEELFRKIRGILNKLTPEKFDTLLEEIMKLQIDTSDKINGVMMLVFEKAVDEPNFSASYARLCQRLADKNLQCEVEESKIKAANSVFKTALLDKTEREFHDNVIDLQAKDTKLKPTIEQLKKCTDPKRKQELQVILEEQEYLLRRRSCGTVRFIGELFKMSMLTSNIIKTCIYKLLDAKSEEKLECLCKLLTTVGKKFEISFVGKETKGCNCLDDVIKKMQNIVDRRADAAKISNRVRFMLQDVIDLRKNKWATNRAESQFKVLEPLQAEQSSAACGYTLPMGKKGDKQQHDSRASGMKSYETECAAYHSKSNVQGSSEELWFKQSTKGSHIVDTNKLKQIFNSDNPIKLGDSSQFMWRRGNTATSSSSTESNALSSTQSFDSTARKHSPSLDNKGDKRECISRNVSSTTLSLSKSNSQSNLQSCKSPTLPKKIKSATVVNSTTSLQIRDRVCSPSDITESDNQKVFADLTKMVDTATEESVKACAEVWMHIPKKLHWVLIYTLFMDYLHLAKTKPATRKTLSDILELLLQNNYLHIEDFKKGYVEFCKVANEIIIDVPNAWKYIFECIGSLIHKKIFSVKFFLNRYIMEREMWKQFLKNFILHFTREIGPKYTRNLWQNLNIEWKDFLTEKDLLKFVHENDLTKFVRENNFLFLEDRNMPPPVPAAPDIEEIIHHVKKLLKIQANTDDVIDYLRGNISSICKTFMHSFTITLCECASKYEHGHYTLDQIFFRNRCVPLLHRYIDSKEDRELECLSAMEEFVSDLAYPGNLLTNLFSELYDADIIPQDSFIKWWHSKQEFAEKTPLILELSRFFSLLSNEASDEN